MFACMVLAVPGFLLAEITFGMIPLEFQNDEKTSVMVQPSEMSVNRLTCFDTDHECERD